MKKIFSICLFFAFVGMHAQFAQMNKILDELENRYGISEELKNENIDGLKFVQIKEFETYTERIIIEVKGKTATFVEIFDEKDTGESGTNVFTGDYIRTNKNMISFRFDKLEGKKTAVPKVLNLLLTKYNDTIYLLNYQTKERWIEHKKLETKK